MSPGTIILGDEQVSREEVLGQAARLAGGLDSLGVSERDTVALLLRNDLSYLVAGRAVRYLGAHVVLLNYRSRSSEVDYIISDSRPSVIVGHADLLWNVRDILPEVPILVVPSEGHAASPDPLAEQVLSEVAGARPWSDFIAESPSLEAGPQASTEAIIYTSGTTGKPKGVRRLPFTDDRGARNLNEMSRVFGIGEGSRALVLGPLYHSLPDTASKLGLELADLLVMQKRFDPELTLAQIERYQITELSLVPTMFVRILKLPEKVRRRYDTSSLRTVIHTGSPCAPDIKQAMIDWWGPIVHELYGATEVGVTFYVDSVDWLKKPGTVGRPLPETTVEIVGPDGKAVPPGEVGEVFALNRLAPDWEYIGREKQTYGDGLVSVGDVGFVDEDGFLFLCDRKNDMIISGGVNVYPAEIEAVVITHPRVADCAVFGAPDPDLGEKVVLAVALLDGEQLEGETLRDYVRERLASHKVPKIVDFHQELPRQESGKVMRRQLREPYWRDVSRSI
ncbi:AMP-binding protein [Aeromicrobium sp. CF4.19]|uniref:AMP-binding protein n=1 Tax=Aeromicrobium sp. CF4.19 TaxID=3373082 RepID=UPI003EE64A7D